MPVVILVHGDKSRVVGYPTSWEDLVIKIKRFLPLDDFDEDKLTLTVYPDWSNTPLELDASALPDFRLPDRSRITITSEGDDVKMTGSEEKDAGEFEEDSDSDEDYDMDEEDEDEDDDVYADDDEYDDFDESSESEDEFLTKGGTLSCLPGNGQGVSNAVSSTASHQFNVDIRIMADRPMKMMATSDMTVGQVKLWVARQRKIAEKEQRLIFRGRPLKNNRTLGHYKVAQDPHLTVVSRLTGGNSTIYLLTSETIADLTISLCLSDDWKLRVLYPPVEAVQRTAHMPTASWTVDVDAKGVMSSNAYTPVETNCLFWEADSVLPKGIPATYQGDFRPDTPNLTPARSRLVERNYFFPYLEKCLQALCLTPSMREDFFRFWRRRFKEFHESDYDIVFKFVEQAEYDKAADLDFSRLPKAVVRIFMVFGTIPRDTREHAEWKAKQGGPKTPEGWRDVVGISKGVLDVMADETKFRVVEWGVMHADPSM